MSTMRRSKGGMMRRDLTREVGFTQTERVNANTTEAEKQKIAFEEYLKNTVPAGPISDLPSPPLTSSSSSHLSTSASPLYHQDVVGDLFEGIDMDSRYRGAAIHLATLIPSAAALIEPSIPLVQRIIINSALPLQTIALAACIVDALPYRFGRTWRENCPPTRPSRKSKRHTLPAPPPPPSSSTISFEDYARDPVTLEGHTREHARSQSLNMDTVPSEIIILCALAIAEKFTTDAANEPPSFYIDCWAESHWQVDQFNATERCIMQCLKYRILPLCEEQNLREAVDNMAVAEQFHDREMRRASRRAPNNIITPPGSGPTSDDEGPAPPPRTLLHRSRPLMQ